MDDNHRGLFFPAGDGDRTAQIRNSISPISDSQQPIFPSISMEETAACFSDYILSDDLSAFGIVNPSSLPFQRTDPAVETKRKLGIHEDGVEEEQTSCDCKGQKRRRSSEVHNLNERLRRQKLQEKMKALRELIPNCDKRDKGHVLDEAMKYIKTLQNQVQMMSMEAGFSMFNSPYMMPQPGMQIPAFPQFPPTDEYGIGIGTMGLGIGIPGLHSMGNLGLPSQCSLASAISGLCAPTPSSSAHSIQNYPGNYIPVMPPWNGISFPTFVSQCTTSPGQGAHRRENEFCPIPEIGEGCSTRRGSKARVLPSQIIRPHVVREFKDYRCSESRSSEWDTTSSIAKSEDCS